MKLHCHPRDGFWPDALGLLAARRLRWDRMLTSRQVTDTSLRALAAGRHGRLVAFARGIPVDAVAGAAAEHLVTRGSVS